MPVDHINSELLEESIRSVMASHTTHGVPLMLIRTFYLARIRKGGSYDVPDDVLENISGWYGSRRGFRICVRVVGGDGVRVEGFLPHSRTDRKVVLTGEKNKGWQKILTGALTPFYTTYDLVVMHKTDLRRVLKGADAVYVDPENITAGRWKNLTSAVKKRMNLPVCPVDTPHNLLAAMKKIEVTTDGKHAYKIPVGDSTLDAVSLLENIHFVIEKVRRIAQTKEIGVTCGNGYVLVGTALGNNKNDVQKASKKGMDELEWKSVMQRVLHHIEAGLHRLVELDFKRMSPAVCARLLTLNSTSTPPITLAESILTRSTPEVALAVYANAQRPQFTPTTLGMLIVSHPRVLPCVHLDIPTKYLSLCWAVFMMRMGLTGSVFGAVLLYYESGCPKTQPAQQPPSNETLSKKKHRHLSTRTRKGGNSSAW